MKSWLHYFIQLTEQIILLKEIMHKSYQSIVLFVFSSLNYRNQSQTGYS